MAIEHAHVRVVRKPWGRNDLQPWSNIHRNGGAIGELWFQRADTGAPEPSLLLKLLFTNAPLSIQVHPNDEFAHSIGLTNGKTEAWYILSATPDAEVAIGLKQELDPRQLRASIEDGSISDLVEWHRVAKNDVIFVPAGTIHAIGAGLVIAEIQQRSDATFRLFDYGSNRELHIENAVAAAKAEPYTPPHAPRRLSSARSVLITSPHFIIEQIDLLPNSNWQLLAKQETWILVLEGHSSIGLINSLMREAVFVEEDCTGIKVGIDGLKALLIYVGPTTNIDILRNLDNENSAFQNQQLSHPPLHHRPVVAATLQLAEASL